MSNRLGDFSQYHIHHLSAHTILTQACLGVLLHSDDSGDTKSVQDLPLAKYAAEHWVEHAQFQGVASRVWVGVETLFDFDKPHFQRWVRIYDIDEPQHKLDCPSKISRPNPVYYSVLCGFYDLVKYLAIKFPNHVNDICGNRFPLFAALEANRVDLVELLLEHGADVGARKITGETILSIALSSRRPNFVNLVKLLLEYGADVNAQDYAHRISLQLAEYRDELDVAQLLERDAHTNAENNDCVTTLHILTEGWIKYEVDALTVALLLLKHGMEVNRRDIYNEIPLHLAIRRSQFKLAEILLEYDADVNAVNNDGRTPLHLLSESDIDDEGDVLNLARSLLKHSVEVNSRDKDNETPLHLAIRWYQFELAGILLEHGADANAQNNDFRTPLHLLSKSEIKYNGNILDLALSLVKHGAEVNRQDKNSETPLHLAVRWNQSQLVGILLEHGAVFESSEQAPTRQAHPFAEVQDALPPPRPGAPTPH